MNGVVRTVKSREALLKILKDNRFVKDVFGYSQPHTSSASIVFDSEIFKYCGKEVILFDFGRGLVFETTYPLSITVVNEWLEEESDD